MDLSVLLIFKTVVEQGGINKAAVKLHRVPSNVTTRIKQLENELGTKLFLREGRGLKISPDGRILLGYAEQLLRLSSEAEVALKKGKPRGTLRIGAIESIATSVDHLPPLLSRYHRLYPDVQVELTTGTPRALVTRVRQGDIEAAFVPQPGNADDLELQTAFLEELVLIAPKNFPRIKSAKDIGNRKVTAFYSGCFYERRMEAWFRKANVKPEQVIDYQSFDAIIACVTEGQGVAIVPRMVIDLAQVDQDFSIHALPKGMAQSRTQLVWRSGHRSIALEALKKLLTLPEDGRQQTAVDVAA